MRTTRLKVTLCEVEPEVLRVVDVPAAATLPELHDLLQVAVGWTDGHLHSFVAGEAVYGELDLDDERVRDERDVRLTDLPGRFRYLYDFGDGWEHDVEVLGAGGDQPACLAGSGACPPEDCGGPYGYAQLLAVLADPGAQEHEQLRAWVGRPLVFDLAATDRLVRETAGEVPGSVRLVLDLLADGVALTPGGRLPRMVVRQVQQARPQWYPLDRPAATDDDLRPLVDLRELLRRVGLVRTVRGVVRPTKVAGDDVQVVRRLRSWFAPGSFDHVLATTAVALLAAHGPQPLAVLAPQLHEMLKGWSAQGRPLTDQDVRLELSRLGGVLRALDLVVGDWPDWAAGPSARTLLPRATALSALRSPYA